MAVARWLVFRRTRALGLGSAQHYRRMLSVVVACDSAPATASRLEERTGRSALVVVQVHLGTLLCLDADQRVKAIMCTSTQ